MMVFVLSYIEMIRERFPIYTRSSPIQIDLNPRGLICITVAQTQNEETDLQSCQCGSGIAIIRYNHNLRTIQGVVMMMQLTGIR